MKEYTIITSLNDQNKEEFFLYPLGEDNPDHCIFFPTYKLAHEYKVALGLGTHPDPLKRPDYYEKEGQNSAGMVLYSILKEREDEADWSDTGCCQSGCPGCPWTEEQMKKGLL